MLAVMNFYCYYLFLLFITVTLTDTRSLCHATHAFRTTHRSVLMASTVSSCLGLPSQRQEKLTREGTPARAQAAPKHLHVPQREGIP